MLSVYIGAWFVPVPELVKLGDLAPAVSRDDLPRLLKPDMSDTLVDVKPTQR